MLKSLNSLLTEVNAQPHHRRWIKYYKKNFSIPKDFNSTFPTLSKFNSVFPFKEIDSGVIKKTLINIKSNPDIPLENELAKLLKIDSTPIPEIINELCTEASKIQITKSNEKNLSLVFDCVTRFFICFSYQFQSIFLAGKLNISCVQSFVQFFLQYQKHQRFVEDVLILFKYFLSKISDAWDPIFMKLDVGCQQQNDLVNILLFLLPISKASIEETKDNGFFDTITKRSFSIFQDIEPKRFSLTIFGSVCQIFTSIIDMMPIVDVKEIDLLCSIASSVLSMTPNFSHLDDSQKYTLGSIFLKIYNNSSSNLNLNDETAKQQFNVIINYVLWIVFTFRDERTISANYEESMNKTELQPIGVSEYFKTVQFIPTGEPLISNQYLTQSANMLNQMIQQSKYKSLLISLLIDAMDKNQKKMKIEQYQSFSAFVLYVIHSCSDQSLAQGFSNYWNVLISEALFPEKNEFDDRNLRDTVLKIFMRCFIAVPSSRSVILTVISDYFTKHRTNELRYFLPLFNNLLALDQDIKFAQELIKSPLMNFLLTESKHYLEIFDFIRHVMYLHSRSCFESRTILKFCFDCIKVQLYRDSMIRCLENALNSCSKDNNAQHVVSSLICEISSSIQSLLKSDIDLAKQFVLILVQSMNTFRPETIPTLFIASTFEILSQFVFEFNSSEIFQSVLSVFIELCLKNNSVYQYFLNKECQVYTYLTLYIKKAGIEFDYTEILFDFAFLNSASRNDKSLHLIKNYHAIPLILEWTKDKEFESKNYSKIYEACEETSANVYELVKADIYTFIIDRIKNIGFNECTKILFKIYSKIASINLPNSAYFDTLKLISLPATDYPEKFISLFNSFLDQLKNRSRYYCNSFFHFEDPSNGIFGPNSLHLGNKFSFVTMLRCECLKSKEPIPFLKMVSDKKETLEFTIFNSQIVMNVTSNSESIENASNQNTSTTFSIKLNDNKEGDEISIHFWNRIIIVVDSNQVSLCVNDAIDQTKATINPLQSTVFNITIGNGFIGDLSDTYFLNEVNLEKINNNITNKNVLCKYIPLNVKDNLILKVCKSPVNFNGQTVLYVNTISDIIKNESSVMNLLPLFSRFSHCSSCLIENSSKRCKVCGSLEIEEGFDFLEKLMNFIITASQENAVFMIRKHFFSILSYYFERMNQCYFSSRFFKLLLSCFRSIKNIELAQEMVESIFQNYDLINKYHKDKQLQYFSEILPKAYLTQKDVFHSYRQFNFLVFLAIAYYQEESDISKNLWRNILTILPNRTDYASYSLLLSIPMFHHYNFSSELIFTCFERMVINQNNFFLKALESMEYFIPFTCIFKYPQIKLQLQAFRIISKLRKKYETSDLIRAIYQIIEYYQPAEDSIKLLSFVCSIFLNDDGSIENAEYFPLIVTISSYINKEEAFLTFDKIMHSIYDNQVAAMKITTDVFNWTYWLLKYIKQFYEFVDEENLSNFSLPFASLIEAQILSLTLVYQEIFTQIITVSTQFKLDSRKIIKSILLYLFTQGQSSLSLSGSDLFKDAFVFIFFNESSEVQPTKKQVSPALNQSSNLNRLCWYEEQLIVNFYFKLRTEFVDEKLTWIDQQLAEAIASKIVLLSNVTVEIFNEQYNGLLLVTYVLITLMRFKSELVISLINEKLINELNQVDQEIAQKSACLILRTKECMLYESENKDETETYLNNIHFDELNQFTSFYVDKEDSNSLQLFLFENSLYKNTKEINDSLVKMQTNYITESNKFTSFVLNINQNSLNAEAPNKNENYYFSSSTVSYANLMVIYADLLNSQDFYFTNAKYYRKQIADSFLKENYVLTNERANMNIHFKAMNNISRKGRRVLASIDYNKISQNLISKSKKSRFSSASLSSVSSIDNTIVRHNQINLSTELNMDLKGPSQNLNILSNQEPNEPSKSKNDNEMYRDIVDLLTPRRLYHGELVVAGKTVTFEGTDSKRSKHIEFNIENILFIMKRIYGRFRKAVEIFTDVNHSYYFIFSCSMSPSSQQPTTQANVTANQPPKTKNKKSSSFGSYRHNFNAFISKYFSAQDKKNIESNKYDFFKDMKTVYGSIYQKKKKGNLKLSDIVPKLEITERWQKRKISNYEYLYYLNILAGRSFNDISKYPIFPIVLLDKPVLDRKVFGILNEDSYRNLGHPVGAIKPDKLKKLLDSFKTVEDMKNKYFYSSMFSNPLIVSSLLSKIEPFSTICSELVHKKSINMILPKKSPNDDEKCISESIDSESDYELTPEFFSFPAVFGEFKGQIRNNKSEQEQQNEQSSDKDQNVNEEQGETIDQQKESEVTDPDGELRVKPFQVPSFGNKPPTVERPFFSLPKWSSSPDEFINVNIRALESDTVTSNLNKWIDLIFGRNRCSASNLNVYSPLLYPENTNATLTQSENDQQAIESGLCPLQLFTSSHPPRQAAELHPLEQIIAYTPPPMPGGSQQGVVVKHESKKPALRIRKNFLITEDLQVTRFTFTQQAKIQGRREMASRPKSILNIKKPISPSVASQAPAPKQTPQSPQLNNMKNRKAAIQLHAQEASQESAKVEDLVHTTQYNIPEIPENFTADIIEVSRSLLLLIFGTIGDSSISICDLRKCKTDRGNGSKTSTNTCGNFSSSPAQKNRTFSDLDERSTIGSNLSGFTADDILVFNSISYPESSKSKKFSKNDDNQLIEPGILLIPPASYTKDDDATTSTNAANASNTSGNIGLGSAGCGSFSGSGIELGSGVFVINNIGQNNALKIVRFDNAAVQCASVAGGTVMTVGLSDGTIRVLQLPQANLIRTSSFHNRPVVSIAANRELGLLVSIDNRYRLIFELLFEHRFIRVQRLDKIIKENFSQKETELNSYLVFTAAPFLLIFKSGTVCAVVNRPEENLSFVVFFNACGDVRGFLEIEGVVKEYDKYYDFDSREILIVAIEPRKIVMIDVARFEILSSSSGSFGQLRFCSVKYLRAIMYGNGRITQTLPFSFTQKPVL